MRPEHHGQVPRLLRAVNLDRLFDLVVLGLDLFVHGSVVRAKAGQDVERFVGTTRLEQPARRFCPRERTVSQETANASLLSLHSPGMK